MSPPVVVWGAGAIGGTIGAALARAGREVLLVDRAEDHVQAINRAGLTITGPIASYSVRVRATTPERLEGTFETVLLAVKGQDTLAATNALRPHLAAGGAVVSVQNGLNERTIAGIVGPERTIGCFVNFGADYQGPGVIMYGGRGAVVVGELDGRRTPRIESLHALLRLFEAEAVLTDNIFGYLWSKLIYGGLLFATALTDEPIADVLEAPRYRPMLGALGREIAAVAAAEGVRLEAFNGFDPQGVHRGRRAARARALVRRDGRLQPQVGQEPQRHLARPRGPQAADRGRRVPGPDRRDRRPAWHRDTAHEPAGPADPRPRAGPQAAGLGDPRPADRRLRQRGRTWAQRFGGWARIAASLTSTPQPGASVSTR